MFFNRFPVISYSNTPAINIMTRVNISKMALNQTQAFYSYTVPDGMHMDSLAYNYYGNPEFDWLVAMSNQVVDPYYDYPLSYDNLNNLILDKYGSFANAQSTILYWQTNWASDDSQISVTAYGALASNMQKYWSPLIDTNNNPYAYVRKQEDWIVTTNQVQQLGISYSNEITTENGLIIDTEDGYDLMGAEGVNAPGTFHIGELVQQNNMTVATVSGVTANSIIIQHTVASGILGPIIGLTSGASATVTSVKTLSQNIANTESNYWTPVSAYDDIQQTNTLKKSVILLDNRYSGVAANQLKSLLTS